MYLSPSILWVSHLEPLSRKARVSAEAVSDDDNRDGCNMFFIEAMMDGTAGCW